MYHKTGAGMSLNLSKLFSSLLVLSVALVPFTQAGEKEGQNTDPAPAAAVESAAEAQSADKPKSTDKPKAKAPGADSPGVEPEKPARNLKTRFKEADMVSLVRINYVSDLINPAMSVRGLVAIQGYMYTSHIVRSWKGLEMPNFKLRVDLSDCRDRLEVEKEYLVFMQRTGYNRFQSYSCEDLVLGEKAQEQMAALDKIIDMQVAKRVKKPNSPI